jgi:hypothetical protein
VSQVVSNKMVKSVSVAVTRVMRQQGKYKDLPFKTTRKFMVRLQLTDWGFIKPRGPNDSVIPCMRKEERASIQ